MEDRIPVFVYASDPISETGIAGQLRGQPAVHVVERGRRRRWRPSPSSSPTRSTTRPPAPSGPCSATACPRVVVVVTRVDDAGLLAALEAGACGIVRRAEARSDRLVAAVRAAVAGDGTMPPDLLGRLLDQIGRLQRQVLAPRGLTIAGLAEREIEVLRLHRRGPRHQRDRRPALLLGADGEERDPRRDIPAAAAQPVAHGGLRHAPGPDLIDP